MSMTFATPRAIAACCVVLLALGACDASDSSGPSAEPSPSVAPTSAEDQGDKTTECPEGIPEVTASSFPRTVDEMDAVTEPYEVRWSQDYPAIAGISYQPETGSIVLDIVGVTDAEAARICRDLRDSSDLSGITVAYNSYGVDSSVFPE